MISKKIKGIIKVSIWVYIFVMVAPDACHQILVSISTISAEGLKWCGGKLLDGAIERGTVHGEDENEMIGGLVGKLLQPDNGISNTPLPQNDGLIHKLKIKEWIDKYILRRKTAGMILPGTDIPTLQDLILKYITRR